VNYFQPKRKDKFKGEQHLFGKNLDILVKNLDLQKKTHIFDDGNAVFCEYEEFSTTFKSLPVYPQKKVNPRRKVQWFKPHCTFAFFF
jgi:hypothetical protein